MSGGQDSGILPLARHLVGEIKGKMNIDKMIDEADKELMEAIKTEENNDFSDALESMERKYWEGYTEALGAVKTELQSEVILKALKNAISEFEWSKDYESAEVIGNLLAQLEKEGN